MDNSQAEENIRFIREVMERSARFTYYSGASAVIGGMLALAACALSLWVAGSIPAGEQQVWMTSIWAVFLVVAISQHFALLQRKARQAGETIWTPAIYTVLKAGAPGLFIAAVLTVYLLNVGKMDLIPSIWALGYGACCYGVGMFNMRAIRVFGVLQLITGALGLFLLTGQASIYVFALSLGFYHIVYGLWLGRKYGW